MQSDAPSMRPAYAQASDVSIAPENATDGRTDALTEMHSPNADPATDATPESTEAEVARYKAAIEAAREDLYGTIGEWANDSHGGHPGTLDRCTRDISHTIRDLEAAVPVDDRPECVHCLRADGQHDHDCPSSAETPVDDQQDEPHDQPECLMRTRTVRPCTFAACPCMCHRSPDTTQPDEQRCEHGMTRPHHNVDALSFDDVRCPGPSSGVGQK